MKKAVFGVIGVALIAPLAILLSGDPAVAGLLCRPRQAIELRHRDKRLCRQRQRPGDWSSLICRPYRLAYTASHEVKHATLTLFVDHVNLPGTVNIYAANGPWTESGVTGNNAPAPGATVASSVTVSTTDAFVTVDATAAVQGWIVTPTGNNGFLIVANGTASVQFDSKEATTTSHAAFLSLVLTDAGPAGPAGAAGPQGSIGLAGATGSQGPIGLIGATGQQGPIGLTGATGQGYANAGLFNASVAYAPYTVVLDANGSAYVTIAGVGSGGADPSSNSPAWTEFAAGGANGPTGPVGAAGLTGATGLQGPIGLTGPAGPQGLIGLPGNTGATGAAGQGYANAGLFNANVVYAPYTVVLDANGSAYVTIAGAASGGGDPSSNPAWNKFAAGGANGPTGPVGPAGLTGAGLQGPIGLTGPAGPQGLIGLTGNTGAMGAAGQGYTSAGVFNPNVVYAPYTVVLDANGSAYVTIAGAASGGVDPSSNPAWMKFAAGGATGLGGSIGPTTPDRRDGTPGACGIRWGGRGGGANRRDGRGWRERDQRWQAGGRCHVALGLQRERQLRRGKQSQ